MLSLFRFGGDVAGGLGALVCIVAGGNRLIGNHHTLGFQSSTLFMAGIALLAFACFLKISYLGRRA